MNAFRVTAINPIRGEKLLAEVSLEMPSGLILRCSVTRSKSDAQAFEVFPAARKTPSGWLAVVEFVNPDRKAAWTKAAQMALVPHIAELLGESCQGGDHAEF